jgi:hypothetical protein
LLGEAAGLPFREGHHARAEAPIVDPHEARSVGDDGLGNDREDVLRHHADEDLVMAEIAEAIERDAGAELAHPDDVGLQATV